MTPADFHVAYRSTADRVSAGTGIDPIALLAQWANETDWAISWAGAPFNLANIENNGVVVSYPSLDAFAIACIATFHNGFYAPVLAATNAIDQLAAIVASPWSAGHYGGSLIGFYTPLEGFEMTPEEHNALMAIAAAVPVDLNADLDAIAKAVPADLATQLSDLKAAIAALPAGQGGLTPAQAQQLTDTLATLQRIEAALKGA